MHPSAAESALSPGAEPSELHDPPRVSRSVRLLSGLINISILVGLLFMLPAYDLVFRGQDVLTTLFYPLVFVAALVAFPTMVDALRRGFRLRRSGAETIRSNNDNLPVRAIAVDSKQTGRTELSEVLHRCRL